MDIKKSYKYATEETAGIYKSQIEAAARLLRLDAEAMQKFFQDVLFGVALTEEQEARWTEIYSGFLLHTMLIHGYTKMFYDTKQQAKEVKGE